MPDVVTALQCPFTGGIHIAVDPESGRQIAPVIVGGMQRRIVEFLDALAAGEQSITDLIVHHTAMTGAEYPFLRSAEQRQLRALRIFGILGNDIDHAIYRIGTP